MPIKESTIFALLDEYKRRRQGFKTLVRVFAASLEKQSMWSDSKVDLQRILNCKSRDKGIRRLSKNQIGEAQVRLKRILALAPSEAKRSRALSRVALRQIAQGLLSPSQAVIYLFYAGRRITQARKKLQRLKPGERYARFTYRELRTASGLSPGKATAAVKALCDAGLLHTLPVAKRNENDYGQLFVDGWLISLVRRMVDCVRRVLKRERPPEEKGKTSPNKRETLIKNYPKRTILKELESVPPRKESKADLFTRLGHRIRTECRSLIPQTA